MEQESRSCTSLTRMTSRYVLTSNGELSELTQQDSWRKMTARRLCVTNVTELLLASFVVFWGAFHLVKISGIFGSAVNGTRFVGSSHWKIPRKSGKSKKVGPFSRLEFPNGMSCSIYVSRSLYQFQVHGRAHRDVPGFKTKWNNFLSIGNSTFAPTEISVFFS